MFDVPADMDRLCGIVVKGDIALIFCDRIREVGQPENGAVFPQMGLVPGKGIIIQGISAI